MHFPTLQFIFPFYLQIYQYLRYYTNPAEQRWIVRIQELAAVPGSALGPVVGSLVDARDALKRGLDILIDGV